MRHIVMDHEHFKRTQLHRTPQVQQDATQSIVTHEGHTRGKASWTGHRALTMQQRNQHCAAPYVLCLALHFGDTLLVTVLLSIVKARYGRR